MKNTPKVLIVSREGDIVSYNKVDLSEWEGVQGEELLSHSFLLDSFRKIMGRTLTLLDSSIQDERQNKAMKNIIRQIFSAEMEFSANMCFDQGVLDKIANKNFEDAEKRGEVPESILVEEALGVEKE